MTTTTLERPASPVPAEELPDVASQQRRGNLLIIDDEEEIRKTLYRQFRKDYNVFTAASAEEGGRMMQTQEIHVVISDQRMPGGTGVEFFRIIRHKSPDATRLLLTGYADINAVIQAINNGEVFRYLTKPWNPDELQAIVREAFDKYWLIVDNRRLQEQQRTANLELEERVQARTSELTRANELLQTEVQQRRQIEAALRQAKEAAEAASRAKSTFLATMSHELRTPMNAILGFSQLLLRDPTLTVSQQHQLTRINRGGTSLMEILNDILEIVRVESGRVGLTPSTTDLHGLLDNLERMFRLRAQAKHLRFHVERHSDLPRGILADEIKLCQILTNLLSNAVKFTPAGGEIIWRMRSSSEPDGTLRLYGEVEDTGVGISPADLQRLFERFFRTETGKDLAGGIGLGLAISLKYVKLMGGELTASSEIGRGSVFQFDVRVERADEALAVAKTEPQPQVLYLLPGSPACRVLVADDQSDNCDLVADILAPLGFDIRTARDGAEAVAICQDWAPQLAILDLRMPVMDGCEAARRIRADHGSAVRILAMSAYVFAENQQRALDAGADVFMQKPFQVVDLLGRIKQLTGVDYVYGESPAAEAGAESVTSGDTCQVPRELVSQLREATSRAKYAQMLALVGQVAVLNESLGNRLRTLVRRFDYEAIQTLLSQEEA